MDRTIIIPYRAEEKELAHVLYNTIQALMLLYPATESLQKCLSDEMFIKPNPQAFFHVMHYLFCIFDQQEFRKRFFWPITDKRSESNFRTSTVEYLKHINDKYHLNWANIKSYLVVMPGGMKFISFLLDFIKFIMQELVKQREKQLNMNINNYRSELSDVNLYTICAKDEIFKGMVSEFIDNIEILNTKYEANTQKLIKNLEALSEESGLDFDLLTDDNFLKNFEQYNSQLFDKFYGTRTRNVLEMDNLIFELKETIKKFSSKGNNYQYDKQLVSQQLQRIRDYFPTDELAEDSFGTLSRADGVNINTLITTFNAINETIQNELRSCNEQPSVGEFVCSRLLCLKKELQEMETQITAFSKMLNDNSKKSNVEYSHTLKRANINETKGTDLENTLLMKLVSTPPIKFQVPEGGCKPRLALLDSKSANANETDLNNLLAPSGATVVRQLIRDQNLMDHTILDLNNTMNQSKIINPRELLRSSSKKECSTYNTPVMQRNTLRLETKLNQRKLILNNKLDQHKHVEGDITTQNQLESLETNNSSLQSFNKTVLPRMVDQSPFTPLSSSGHRSRYQLDSSICESGNISSTSSNYVKKLSVVKKVQDASINIANLSTSPSGRLEPLVSVEELNIAKLKLNNISLIDDNLSSANSLLLETHKLLINATANNITFNDGRNTNPDSIKKQANDITTNIYDQEEDALFNISDTVLKDVIL